MNNEADFIINNTKKWVGDVVVGLNFCPFAAREVKRGSIRYVVEESQQFEDMKEGLLSELKLLDAQPDVETTLLIYPNQFHDFTAFLEFAEFAEGFLEATDYEGIYQVATFHPQYVFAGSTPFDAANYTNRSPYAMLHIIREDSLEAAIASHPDIDSVPDTNIAHARQLGLVHMKNLLAACFQQ
ncbi:DUF1415 family protein [bacterium]|nr:DUF1415 family protein [bacterium]